MSKSQKPLALYIHWPFCKAKCPYCDFNSHVREGVNEAAWQQALLAELAYTAGKLGERRLVSIFFGGGTPTLMPPAIAEALIEAACGYWKAADDIEITLEANPTSVEASKFQAFKAAGVNRVSLGVQSLKEEQLAFLGREHSAGEALKAVELAAKTFDRYSFDLIYALPGQTPVTWEKELRAALAYARGHLSLYQLTIEPNTAFQHYYDKGKFTLPEEGLSADMYELTQTIMNEAGLPAYEISNHAAAGQESRHNLAYWRGEEYAGIGPGAHGRLQPKEGSRIATATLKSPERWLSHVQQHGHGLEQWQSLTPEEIREERVLMGLRIAEGVLSSLLSADKEETVKQLENHHLITAHNERIVATDQGRLMLNYVIGELLS